MNTIQFNNSTPIQVSDFSNGVFFRNNTIEHSGTCTVIADSMNSLISLGEEPLTSIKIYNDNTLIYNLENITGRIVSITEVLDDTHVSVLIAFSIDLNI